LRTLAGGTVRPTTILSLITGVLIALGGIGLGIYLFWDRPGGRDWFYWAAPLLTLAFGGLTGSLLMQYRNRVGRLETKGRPRSA
jgi:hypothetical protein